jgi:hypothetical protein
MANDHDDSFDTALLQIVETAFDDGLVSEGKKRFECAHAL